VCVVATPLDLRTRGSSSVGEVDIDPDAFPWAAWHPTDALRALAGVEAPWYVAAGWSIDLWLGGGHREHEDLELAVPSARFREFVQPLARAGLELYPLVEDRAVPLAEVGSEALAESHQTWALERAAGVWRVDLFREPSEGGTWIARRDESIRMPYEELIRFTTDRIPYARPEVTILFKAKHTREKDDADFAAVLPRLGDAERRWLANALALVHPGHGWIAALV
jgi:hypothetical protein